MIDALASEVHRDASPLSDDALAALGLLRISDLAEFGFQISNLLVCFG